MSFYGGFSMFGDRDTEAATVDDDVVKNCLVPSLREDITFFELARQVKRGSGSDAHARAHTHTHTLSLSLSLTSSLSLSLSRALSLSLSPCLPLSHATRTSRTSLPSPLQPVSNFSPESIFRTRRSL